ncbi:MAG: class I SAM-dependent methyltransferase [Candidatus Eremiobacteraeota bacterium]|nr:class I SAM-dependent methyltransferase [Candidatus Eremiobacteraeota bacterium]
MTSPDYTGQELALFSAARNWKLYLKGFAGPHLRGRVLEVGAGMGGTTRYLCDGTQKSWMCLEPDPSLSALLRETIGRGEIPPVCQVKEGILADLKPEETFDTILYIDVIEHIDNDQEEVGLALSHLAPGGSLIILAPALQWLYSPFDREIGHFRRYDRKMMRSLLPPGMKCLMEKYLDCTGVLLLLGNRLLARQKMPSEKQVRTWDRFFVPLSKALDPLFRYSFGRSLLGIWQNTENLTI